MTEPIAIMTIDLRLDDSKTEAEILVIENAENKLMRASDTKRCYLIGPSGVIQEMFPHESNLDPGVDDDVTSGNYAGQLWTNSTSGDLFKCSSASEGAAVWDIVSGEANTNSNAGSGYELVNAKVGVDTPIKSLLAGPGVVIDQGAEEIEISSTGESNTNSNAGTGAGLVKTKVDVDTPIRTARSSDGTIAITEETNDLDFVANVTASDVTTTEIDGTDLTSVQDFLDWFPGRGYVSGCEATDNGDGTVTFSDGVAWLSNGAELGLPSGFVKINGATLTMVDGATNFIVCRYNVGSITIESTLNPTPTLYDEDFSTINVIYREGTNVHPTNYEPSWAAFNTLISRKGIDEAVGKGNRFADWANGVLLSIVGTRNVNVSAGVFYASGLNRKPVNEFDTYTGGRTFRKYWRDGASGHNIATGLTQIPNDEYDDGSGTISSLGSNDYGVYWMYMDYAADDFSLVLGTDSYNTLAAAEQATRPADVPAFVSDFSVFIGRVIIGKGEDTPDAVESAFAGEAGGLAPVTQHTQLGNVNGAVDVQHLTAAQVAVSQRDDRTHIYCLGDSITHGTSGTPYPDRLAELRPKDTVTNMGISGINSDEMVRRDGSSFDVELLPTLGKLQWDFRDEKYYPFTEQNGASFEIVDDNLTINQVGATTPYAQIRVVNEAMSISISGTWAGDGTANPVLQGTAAGVLATGTSSATEQTFSGTISSTAAGEGIAILCDNGADGNFVTLIDLQVTMTVQPSPYPDVVINMVGTNDVLDLTLDESIQAFEFIHNQCRLCGVKGVSPNITPSNGWATWTRENLEQLESLRQLQRESLAPSVQFETSELGDENGVLYDYYTIDNVHPDDAGNIKLAQIINDGAFSDLKPSGLNDAEAVGGVPVVEIPQTVELTTPTRTIGNTDQKLAVISRSNKLIYPNHADATVWTKTRMIVSNATGVPSPIPGVDYQGLVGTAVTDTHRIDQLSASLSAGYCKVSAIVKAGDVDWFMLFNLSKSDYQLFDLANIALGVSAGDVKSRIINLGTGVYIEMQCECAAGTNQILFVPSTSNSASTAYLGNGTTVDTYIAGMAVVDGEMGDNIQPAYFGGWEYVDNKVSVEAIVDENAMWKRGFYEEVLSGKWSELTPGIQYYSKNGDFLEKFTGTTTACPEILSPAGVAPTAPASYIYQPATKSARGEAYLSTSDTIPRVPILGPAGLDTAGSNTFAGLQTFNTGLEFVHHLNGELAVEYEFEVEYTWELLLL